MKIGVILTAMGVIITIAIVAAIPVQVWAGRGELNGAVPTYILDMIYVSRFILDYAVIEGGIAIAFLIVGIARIRGTRLHRIPN